MKKGSMNKESKINLVFILIIICVLIVGVVILLSSIFKRA